MTALLSHTNVIPGATLSLSVGSSTNLDNLKSFQVPSPFAEIATSAGAFTLSSTFAAQPVRVLSVVMTDLQAGAEIRLNVYAAGTPLFGEHVPYVVDEGPYTTDDGLVYSVLTAQTGYISELEPVGTRSTILVTLPETVEADELRVFVEGAQASVRVGALWAGPAFVSDIGPGWSVQHNDLSLVNRVGATPWVSRRAITRTLSVTWPTLSEPEAIGAGGLQPLFKRLGASAPVILVPRSLADYASQAVYGLLPSPGSVTHIRGPWWRAECDVEEIGG